LKILIVEDTKKLAQSLADHFDLAGHSSSIAGTVEAANELVSLTHYDIMLLDIMLPDGNGHTFLRSLRLQKIAVPVIVMTARSEISDRIDLLDIGADDYIIKPFDIAELEARCRAVLRRHGGGGYTNIMLGNIELSPLTAELRTPAENFKLRNRELRLLEIFMNAPNILFTKEQLTDRLFNISESVNENTIEVYIARIRKKLIGCNMRIETLRGIGYRLTETFLPK
jgi:DNA-binding response OmpR family regulator|tara:strand:+ start:639 stop:1316 length:678 start_codon:yes stop_codon:yes gene_type:complete